MTFEGGDDCLELILDTLLAGLASKRRQHANGSTTRKDWIPGQASLWWCGKRASIEECILHNTFLAHDSELDCVQYETFGHPGSMMVPTLLAVGERESLRWCQALDAIDASFNFLIEVAQEFGLGLRSRSYHPTATLGALASADLQCRLQGADLRTRARALNAASVSGLGFQSAFGTDLKAWQTAQSCASSYRSVQWVIDGKLESSSSREIWKENLQVLAASRPDKHESPAPEHWRSRKRTRLPLSYKKAPFCAYFVPVVEALSLEVSRNLPHVLSKSPISISLSVPAYALQASLFPHPLNEKEAQFSLHFLVEAVTLGLWGPKKPFSPKTLLKVFQNQTEVNLSETFEHRDGVPVGHLEVKFSDHKLTAVVEYPVRPQTQADDLVAFRAKELGFAREDIERLSDFRLCIKSQPSSTIPTSLDRLFHGK